MSVIKEGWRVEWGSDYFNIWGQAGDVPFPVKFKGKLKVRSAFYPMYKIKSLLDICFKNI